MVLNPAVERSLTYHLVLHLACLTVAQPVGSQRLEPVAERVSSVVSGPLQHRGSHDLGLRHVLGPVGGVEPAAVSTILLQVLVSNDPGESVLAVALHGDRAPLRHSHGWRLPRARAGHRLGRDRADRQHLHLARSACSHLIEHLSRPRNACPFRRRKKQTGCPKTPKTPSESRICVCIMPRARPARFSTPPTGMTVNRWPHAHRYEIMNDLSSLRYVHEYE